jgi:hypothetical protein
MTGIGGRWAGGGNPRPCRLFPRRAADDGATTAPTCRKDPEADPPLAHRRGEAAGVGRTGKLLRQAARHPVGVEY